MAKANADPESSPVPEVSIANSTPKTQGIQIIFSNDVLGEVEPCGCRSNPQGGIYRKMNFLNSIKGSGPILQIDAGDLFFETKVIAPMLENQAKLTAESLAKAHNITKLNYFVPGEKDFALGRPFFEHLRKLSKFTFLAANLRLKGKKTPYLKEFDIWTAKWNGKQVRIGVFGLIGNELASPDGLPDEFVVDGSTAVATRIVAKLKKEKVSAIIAITHQGLEADEKLALEVPGIDWIIGGHTQSFLQTASKIESTQIGQASFRNQFLGQILLDEKGKTISYALKSLDATLDSPKDKLNELDQLASELKASIAKDNIKIDREMKDRSPRIGLAGLEHFQTVSNCAGCHQAQTDFWMKTKHSAALQTLKEVNQLRNKDCVQCHSLGMGHEKGWTNLETIGRLKEDAFNDLKASNEKITRDFSIEQVEALIQSIRKTEKPSDPIEIQGVTFTDEKKNPLVRETVFSKFEKLWAPHQCENCHQNGGEHPFSSDYKREVKVETCQSCHNPERAPAWYTKDGILNQDIVQKKMALIQCPKMVK